MTTKFKLTYREEQEIQTNMMNWYYEQERLGCSTDIATSGAGRALVQCVQLALKNRTQ